MKSKGNCLIVIETISIIAFAVFDIFCFRYNVWNKENYLLQLLVELAIAGFGVLNIVSYVIDVKSTIKKFIGFAFVIEVTVYAILNDSLIGIYLCGLFMICLVCERKRIKKFHSVVWLMVASVVTTEVMSILGLTDIVSGGALEKWIQGYAIDVIFVIVIVLECIIEKDKCIAVMQRIMTVVAVIFDLACVLALVLALFFRYNDYAISSDEISDGMKVSVIDAKTGTKAITWGDDNWLTVSEYVGDSSQICTIEKSEDKGYYHIVREPISEEAETQVFDVWLGEYYDSNMVLCWGINEGKGQHWKFEDAGNNLVRIEAYDSEYKLTWGYHREDDGTSKLRTMITTDSKDYNQVFFLKNAEIADTPVIGWIIDSNRVMQIAVYAGIMMFLAVYTLILGMKVKK